MGRKIKLNYITKIEGHAKLDIKIGKDCVEDVNLEIYEGARFFEDILKDTEVLRLPQIVARICGMCSVAHQMAACVAVENAYGVKVTKQVRVLREILLKASIIQSHTLHLFFMAIPDYFNVSGAIKLAKERPDIINLGISLITISKKILEVIGGREMHCITPRIGKFNALPSQKEIDDLKELFTSKIDGIKKDFFSIFSLIKNDFYESSGNFISLNLKDDMKINSLDSGSIDVLEYLKKMSFSIKDYSSAKFIRYDNRDIITCSLSRVNLNWKSFSDVTKEFIKAIDLKLPSKNPFDNNLCQAVEILEYMKECLDLLSSLKIKEEKSVEIDLTKDVVGFCALEVPRGLLLHKYTIKKGIIKKCDIITPTTQNVQNIEDDIKKFVPFVLDKSDDEIKLFIERLIRAYDPCISCSTHFLDVRFKRE